MPVVRRQLENIEPGMFYANLRTGKLVEVMGVDQLGNCRVLDAGAALDAPWEHLSYEQIASCTWQLVSGGGSDEPSHAA
jgi:hypothetical protein